MLAWMTMHKSPVMWARKFKFWFVGLSTFFHCSLDQSLCFLAHAYLFAMFATCVSGFLTTTLPLMSYSCKHLTTILLDIGWEQLFCYILPIYLMVKHLLCLLVVPMKLSSWTIVIFGGLAHFQVIFWSFFDSRSIVRCMAPNRYLQLFADLAQRITFFCLNNNLSMCFHT